MSSNDQGSPPFIPELPEPEAPEEELTQGQRVRRILFGRPLDLTDSRLFHRISLVAFLAWVGLGADGLSSSSYGPQEAFIALGRHTYLAVGLALAVTFTIFIIAAGYARIIEHFPYGGGGYVVATKLLGERAGVVSGCALLVDYMLTITVSIAAAGDAIFSLLPFSWQHYKVALEILLIVTLAVLNIRGIRESVLVLFPIFLIFLVTHVVLILGTLGLHWSDFPALAGEVQNSFQQGRSSLGLWAMVLLFLRAYSLGGGTYTGLEAVSNGLPIMREPRERTAKHTMLYMAISLAFCAGGLLVCYLLLGVTHVPGKTLNAVLTERLSGEISLGTWFVIVTLLAEGLLLVVGAQAGFIDGPRVLANLAVDSWMPRQFASLSERMTMQNGVLLMSGGSLAALLYTGGDVRHLVVMYSINVFLTFSLSMFSMLKMFWTHRAEHPEWRQRAALFASGFLLCATILVITTIEKFREGGWLTVAVTSALIALCFLIRRHYRRVAEELEEVNKILVRPITPPPGPVAPPDPSKPTAGILVGAYGGTGIHMIYNVLKMFPGHFKNLVFISVGVIGSGQFKGQAEIEFLRQRTQEWLDQYIQFAHSLGLPATGRLSLGTDVVAEADKVCREVAKDFPKTIFFAGEVIFRDEGWFDLFLHNRTSYAIQKRLQWSGRTMVILPMRLTLK